MSGKRLGRDPLAGKTRNADAPKRGALGWLENAEDSAQPQAFEAAPAPAAQPARAAQPAQAFVHPWPINYAPANARIEYELARFALPGHAAPAEGWLKSVKERGLLTDRAWRRLSSSPAAFSASASTGAQPGWPVPAANDFLRAAFAELFRSDAFRAAGPNDFSLALQIDKTPLNPGEMRLLGLIALETAAAWRAAVRDLPAQSAVSFTLRVSEQSGGRSLDACLNWSGASVETARAAAQSPEGRGLAALLTGLAGGSLADSRTEAGPGLIASAVVARA